jgi:hypothetical protein
MNNSQAEATSSQRLITKPDWKDYHGYGKEYGIHQQNYNFKNLVQEIRR